MLTTNDQRPTTQCTSIIWVQEEDGLVSFDLQPTLIGELLEVHPLREEDFEATYQAASDPLIWEQHPQNERYKREVFLDFFRSAMDSKGAFAVIERATGRIIGSSRYWNYKPEESEIEIGWTFLERKFWGGRYNGELKRLMIDHALRQVERVVFTVGVNNWRSRKAVEKIGGRLVRTVERPGPDGIVRRNVVFEISRQGRGSASTGA